jgi:hypothetical protein
MPDRLQHPMLVLEEPARITRAAQLRPQGLQDDRSAARLGREPDFRRAAAADALERPAADELCGAVWSAGKRRRGCALKLPF